MDLVARALTAIVGLLHLGFLVLEMFLWTTPRGRAIFGTTPEFAASSAVLAANQGLYNGFLAAGLFWGAATGRADISYFFLACVAVAGLYGAWSVNARVLVVQALPALLAIAALWMAGR